MASYQHEPRTQNSVDEHEHNLRHNLSNPATHLPTCLPTYLLTYLPTYLPRHAWPLRHESLPDKQDTDFMFVTFLLDTLA